MSPLSRGRYLPQGRDQPARGSVGLRGRYLGLAGARREPRGQQARRATPALAPDDKKSAKPRNACRAVRPHMRLTLIATLSYYHRYSIISRFAGTGFGTQG